MNTLAKIALCLIFYLCLNACTKTEMVMPAEPEKKSEDLDPESFEVSASEITGNSASLVWSESLDPEYGAVTYTVELEGKTLASDLSSRKFKLENLAPSQLYRGKIAARDPSGNVFSVAYEFRTVDGIIKFSKQIFVDNPSGMGGTSILTTADGGYLIAGTIGFGTLHTLLVKVSAQGEVLWYKTLEIFPGRPRVVEVPGGYAMSTADHVLKFDFSGNLIWKKQLDIQGTTDTGELYSIRLTKDNHLILVGMAIEHYVIPITDQTNLTKAAIYKLDLSGKVIWKKIHGSKRRNKATDVVEDQNGNLYMCGERETGYDSSTLWIFKLDKDGHELWSRGFEDTAYSFSHSIRITPDQKLVVAGYQAGLTNNLYLLKCEMDGTLVKMIRPKFGFAEMTFDLVITHDGGIALATSMEGSYNSKAGILKYDANLNLLWNKTYDGKQYGMGRSLLQTADRGFILTGSTGGTTIYDGPAPLTLIKTNPDGDVQ